MNNAGLSIFERCKFDNNMGTSGASIHMEEGGTLIGIANSFSLDPRYLAVPT